MKLINTEELTEKYLEEVFDKADEIDPSSEQDWFSLALGWALANGLSADDAHDFAMHTQYDSN